MQILKRKSIQSPRDLICIFIGAELENVVNGEYAQEWCFCFVYDFQLLSSQSTHILFFRMKNINTILDKLLIANLSMIIANTDLLYLTIDNMMIETSGESPESEPVRQNQLLIDRETGQTLHVHM